jgi:AcrR family transcriptional regulator
MVAATARYGYGDASVARAIKLAGVSRATFYEHFANKDECILTACRQLAGAVEWELEQERDDLPREILRAFLGGADRDPAAARFLLIETLAAGPAVRAEQNRLLGVGEEAVERYLTNPPPGAPVLGIGAAAAMGGITNVMAVRLFRGEIGRLNALRDDLLAWIGSYEMPPSHPRPNRETWRELGRTLAAQQRLIELPEDPYPPASSGVERRKIVDAVTRLAVEKGYTAMTVADMVAGAGITREAFYEQFRGKADAYQAAQAFALEAGVSVTAARFFGERAWRDRVWNGLEGMLRFAVSRFDLVYVDLIESYAAGPSAIRRSIEHRMAFNLFLEDGYRQRPQAGGLPRLCSEAIGGAIWEMLRRQVFADQGTTVDELIPQVVYLALAPFLGPVAALELVEARCASE